MEAIKLKEDTEYTKWLNATILKDTDSLLNTDDHLLEQVDLDKIESSVVKKPSSSSVLSSIQSSQHSKVASTSSFQNCTLRNSGTPSSYSNKNGGKSLSEHCDEIALKRKCEDDESKKSKQIKQSKVSTGSSQLSSVQWSDSWNTPNKLEGLTSQVNETQPSKELPKQEILSGNSVLSLTQRAKVKDLQSVISKELKNNASKSVTPPNLVNKTLVEERQTCNLGSFYGLPNKVKDLIKLYKGIDDLYDWQKECLELDGVKQRRNLVYSLPTSGGKTLVAEILILKEILCRKQNAILVLPYVSIVQEKVWSLSPFAVALDFLIEEYAAGKGTYPPKKRRYKNSLYIATTEKALGIVNSLIEQKRLNEVGLIVVDELHLIGEKERGATLEMLLTKLMYMKEGIQIVGMSATIGNLPDVSKFLNAVVYTQNFRPVELMEYIKCEDKILKINYQSDAGHFFELARTSDFNYSQWYIKKDPDRLGGLVMEVVPNNSVLIFCSTKASCENVTFLLCNVLGRAYPSLKFHREKEKNQLVESLSKESGGHIALLRISIPLGIAYHHSGLTIEERRLIEDGYRLGIICVICCTSTLAAGVNLPASRVIIREPRIAKDFISLSRYKQMVGRAGRAGLGDMGESILICKRENVYHIKQLLMSPMDEVLSQMNISDDKSLRYLFLSCISLGTACTRIQLEKIANMTLLAVQQDKLEVKIKEVTKKVISDLYKLGAIEIPNKNVDPEDTQLSLNDLCIELNSEDVLSIMDINKKFFKNSLNQDVNKQICLQKNTSLQVSKLGKAAIKGNLDLREIHMLHADLTQAQESLVLLDSLHLLYLVTPYSMAEQIRPNNQSFYDILRNLNEKEKKTANILGINDACIVALYSSRLTNGITEQILSRFYIALMLYDMWNETSINEVVEKYQTSPGFVQTLMTSASSFASNVIRVCEELKEFWPFAQLLKGISERLSHCCSKELLPLMELPAVKQNRARQLYKAGYINLPSIANAKPEELKEAVEFMSIKVANQMIAAAKLYLVEKVETLRETAEDVMEGVENFT